MWRVFAHVLARPCAPNTSAVTFKNCFKVTTKVTDFLCSRCLQVWDKYLSAVGQCEALNREAFVDSMKKLVGDPSLKPTLEGPLPLFFHAVDANDDGLISVDEYAQFFEVRV